MGQQSVRWLIGSQGTLCHGLRRLAYLPNGALSRPDVVQVQLLSTSVSACICLLDLGRHLGHLPLEDQAVATAVVRLGCRLLPVGVVGYLQLVPRSRHRTWLQARLSASLRRCQL